MPTKTEKEIKLLAAKINREADTIQLPKGMSIPDAIKVLEKKHQEEENPCMVQETIEAFPFDAAHALYMVLHERYGFVSVDGGRGMFGPNPCPMVPLSIGLDSVVQVPWGEFTLPGIDGKLSCGFTQVGKWFVFALNGKVKGKHKSIVSEIAQEVREKLKTHSVYRGQAITVSYRDADGKKLREIDPFTAPKFMRLDGSDPIFNHKTQEQIDLGILNQIRHSKALKKGGYSLRRSVVLHGTYGTGKTLEAGQVARECVKNGWTFIHLTDCRDLTEAMTLADQYSPACVFTEDVDRVMSGARDAEMDQLTYALDGVDTKGKDVMVVLTTNNVEAIRQVFKRPGRIDTFVEVTNPDAETVYSLLKFYAGKALVASREQCELAIQPMVGQSPAFVTEVVKKARLRAITRDGDLQITAEDIGVAAEMMAHHVKLMNKPEPKEVKLFRTSELVLGVPDDSYEVTAENCNVMS